MATGAGSRNAHHYSDGSGVTNTAFASSYGVLRRGDGMAQKAMRVPRSAPARRASSIVVVLDLVVAKQADLVATLARPEVLISHIHVLHAEWAAW